MSPRLIFVPFVALLAVAAILAACGDDDDATSTPAATTAAATATGTPAAGAPTLAEAEAFLQTLLGTYNSGEVEEFFASFSDDALLAFTEDEPGTSREDAIAGVLEFLGGNTITIHEVTEDSSADDSITVHMESDDGATVALESFTLERGDEDLVVAAFERLEPEVPADYTKVLVEGTEFQYIFDSSEIAGGETAFEFSNIGSQFHELYLLEIDATTPVADIVTEALGATDPSQLPASVLADIGPVFAGPGDSTIYLPAEPFEAGRYMMICFIPDQSVPEGEEGEPHAAKGMYAEFTIP